MTAPEGTKWVVSDPWYRRWFGWTYVLTRGQTSAVAAGAGGLVGAAIGDNAGAALGGYAGWALGQYAVEHGECIAINFAYWGMFPGFSGCTQ